MKFTADREEFAAVIARVAAGIPSHPVKDIYAGILMRADWDTVELVTSDGDVTFISGFKPDVHETGSVVMPALVHDISRYFPRAMIDVSTAGAQVTIGAGKSAYALPAADGDGYPSWMPAPPPLVTLDAGEFTAAARKVLPAASKDHPVLQSILLRPEGDTMTMMSTDRYKMAVGSPQLAVRAAVPEGVPEEVLVPARVLERFLRTADGGMSLGWDQSLVSMRSSGLQVIARQVAGRPLDWRSVMARDPGDPRLLLLADELIRAVKLAALSSDGFVGLRFEGSSCLVSSSGEKGRIAEEIPVAGDAEKISFRMGVPLLLDAAACGDHLEVSYSTPLAPVYIRCEGIRWMIQPARSE